MKERRRSGRAAFVHWLSSIPVLSKIGRLFAGFAIEPLQPVPVIPATLQPRPRSICLFIALLGLWLPFVGAAQVMRSLGGHVLEKGTEVGLPGASVLLLHASDTTDRRGVATNIDGMFLFTGVADGAYLLRTSFVGFETEQRSLQVSADITGLRVELRPSSIALKAVEVEAVMKRVEQRGDTTIYNANAFQVHPDATAEDLVTKLPGVVNDNGTIKAQGEKVKRVLVDGEEFFGDDASIALKNLPAEIIDKVEVFDRLSEQARFTGFDDGNRDKTLNIVTKSGRNQGVFGRAAAGYGTDERYLGSLSLNWFKGTQRLSLLGQSNNINQQNFSAQDLVGLSEGGGGRGGRQSSDLMVGARPGINTTHAIGVNYTNKFGKGSKLTGSYFFNRQHSANTSLVDRTTYLSDTTAQYSTSTQDRSSVNDNHRLNFRLEHAFDSTNSIVVTPQLSFQRNTSSGLSGAGVENDAGILLSRTSNENRTRRDGLTFTNGLLYRHRFALKGRTFSANLTTSIADQDSRGTLLADNWYATDTVATSRLDQRSNGGNLTQRHGLELNYTEPLSPRSQLQLNLAPAVQLSDAEKLTYDEDADTGSELLNTRLSNSADNTINTLRGGLSYRLRDGKVTFNAGVEGLSTGMESEQTYPYAITVRRDFFNVLPNAMLMYKPDKLTRLRVNYRTTTRTPSITQLQNVVDNSDPLKLTTGNLALEQGYQHALSFNLNTSDSTRTRPFFAMVMLQAEQDRISNVTYASARDSVLADGTSLPAGAQLTMPVNLDGYLSGRLLGNYTLPVPALKSNVNFSAGGSAERLPGAVNDVTYFTWNTNANAGLNISTSTSKQVDFRLGYTANINAARSGLRTSLDNRYYQGRLSGKLVLNGLKGWVLENEVNYDQYVGLGTGFDQDAIVWNAALAYKFLKNDALELRVTAYDILKRNVSVNREVSDTYIQNTATNMLRQYFMFTLSYNLRAFKGAAPPAPDGPPGGYGPPPGEHGPGPR